MAENLLTVDELGVRLGTKRQTTYRLIWSGVVEPVDIRRPGAKRPSWRIPESAIDALVAARRAHRPGGVATT